MTRASREVAARMQMLFSEREQVVVLGLGTDAAIPCLIAAVTLELWNVEMDSLAQEVRALQLQLWEWQTHCIMLPNIFTTLRSAWYVTPYRRCSLWACAATAHHAKLKNKGLKISGTAAGRIKKSRMKPKVLFFFWGGKVNAAKLLMFLLQFWSLTCKEILRVHQKRLSQWFLYEVFMFSLCCVYFSDNMKTQVQQIVWAWWDVITFPVEFT